LSPDVVVDEQKPGSVVGNRHTIGNVFAPAKFHNRAHFFHTAVLMRIAIARAFLKDAPILWLDEATAALDSESEEAIREALARLMRGRTVIAIAHCLATLRNFDRVVMLQGGRIIEDGPPDRLMQGRGPYRELVAREMSRLAAHAA
jgi:ABC-type glutathione transport system ATPase component